MQEIQCIYPRSINNNQYITLTTNDIFLFQCKKLAADGDEMMFMTVNLNKRTTTCIGSQLGVDFMNNALPQISPEPQLSTSISQLFQFHIEGL